jgi:Icc-related predicted phosphoesterase
LPTRLSTFKENILRIVALSDTHGFHKNLTVPDGELLIHAGDFAMRAKKPHVVEFAEWFKSLPHPYKIIVPGNHDCYLDGHNYWGHELFAPAIYLDHEYCEVMGLKIFGSPYSSSIYEPSMWSFDYPREGFRSKELWDSITGKLDILITHGPPYGILDLVENAHVGEDPHVGDLNLLYAVERSAPMIHLFGHIHECHGTTDNERTKFYNVSVCNLQYKPVNPITVIDL